MSSKCVDRNGITAVIINKDRILLLERIRLPFMAHPGRWSFISGGRKGSESPLENAYREIKEELGLDRPQLRMLARGGKVTIRHHGKDLQWENDFFIFRTSASGIRLMPLTENRRYRWVTLGQLKREENSIIGFYANEGEILRSIKSAIESK